MPLRPFIRQVILEAERDAKELEKINYRELRKKGHMGLAGSEWSEKELQYAAKSRPIFSSRTIWFIRNLRDRQLPTNDRKRFVKWLANQVEERVRASRDEDITRSPEILQNIVDWINAEGTDEYLNGSFQDADYAAERWHHSRSMDDDLQISSQDENVIHRWDDGWKVVRVPPGDCSAEGQAMGHCVSGYADKVRKGHTMIYSLRDPKDRPHVTVELILMAREDGSEWVINQIKGKQNAVPKDEYGRRVIEWIKSSGFRIDTTDYLRMLMDDPEELLRILPMMVESLVDEIAYTIEASGMGAVKRIRKMVRDGKLDPGQVKDAIMSSVQLFNADPASAKSLWEMISKDGSLDWGDYGPGGRLGRMP